MADSARWERFQPRADDIVISTPSKCGTTWMQNIVGMLVLDRPVLGVPISTVSPWLDMLIRTDDEVFAMLDAQQHRRWIKTHTPLDGLPLHPSVTYIAVVRHPLDVALSDRDHRANTDDNRAASCACQRPAHRTAHWHAIRNPALLVITCAGSSTTTHLPPGAVRTDSTTSVNK